MTSSRRAAVLAAVLALTTACTHQPAAEHTTPGAAGGVGAAPQASAAPVNATPADVLRAGPVFGVHPAALDTGTIDQVAAGAGCRPGWVERFASVAGGVTVEQLNTMPGLPLLSLEPWQDGKVNDPRWTLASTISGDHDEQLRKVAAAVRAYARPVLLRYAHEMNGAWYPWGPVGRNTPEQYRQAWRHVVALFDAAGASNVLWVWSPNILRGAVKTPTSAFYPGDDVVDFVGLTGYGEYETSPDVTYASTLTQLATFTTKQIILTEVGVRPSSRKTGWIRGFGAWLAAHPNIVGFIWSMRPPGDGARYDWRFDDSATNLAAFKASLTEGHVAC